MNKSLISILKNSFFGILWSLSVTFGHLRSLSITFGHHRLRTSNFDLLTSASASAGGEHKLRPSARLRLTHLRSFSSTDGRTDVWTDGRKISPFYRTLSPIGAAALLQPKNCIKRGKGTADHMMPLNKFIFLVFMQFTDFFEEHQMQRL